MESGCVAATATLSSVVEQWLSSMAQTSLMAVEATGWPRSLPNTRPSGATPSVAMSGAQDGDQFRWDGHAAGLVGAPVLEPRLPCAESVSVQRRWISGRDFS